MQSITDVHFMDTKYERVAEVARVMTEGEAVVLVVLNGKEEAAAMRSMRRAD